MDYRLRAITFDEQSRASTPLWATPYDNRKGLTVYFENSVIRKLVSEGDHLGTKLYGVVSWKFWQGLNIWRTARRLSPDPGTYNTFLDGIREPCDIMLLRRYEPSKMQLVDPVKQADTYHPGFSEIFWAALEHLGISTDTKCWTVIYSNCFMARPEVYEDYVRNWLAPFMDFLDSDATIKGRSVRELAYADSGYKKKAMYSERLKEETGYPYYTYHTFLCERLPSVYIKHVNPQITQWGM